MTYQSDRIPFSEALEILDKRGTSEPWPDFLAALRDGGLKARGLCGFRRGASAGTREIPDVWWYHLDESERLRGDVVWFRQADTETPTPVRAEQLTVLRADIERLWPVPSSANAPAVMNGATPLKKKRGRPTGSGIRGDDEIVQRGLAMISNGEANNPTVAAEKLAGDPDDPTYKARRDRYRKKIANARNAMARNGD